MSESGGREPYSHSWPRFSTVPPSLSLSLGSKNKPIKYQIVVVVVVVNRSLSRMKKLLLERERNGERGGGASSFRRFSCNLQEKRIAFAPRAPRERNMKWRGLFSLFHLQCILASYLRSSVRTGSNSRNYTMTGYTHTHHIGRHLTK